MANLNELKPVQEVQNIIDKFCYTIGMLPASYKASLTYEEQVMAIGRYLEETVIPALNNNAKCVLELQNLFIDLKNYVENYFNNLDIEAEINKKLDKMIENGTLQQIMNNFLTNSVISFNNVHDMKNCNFLINNSNARTMGYYEPGDNGGTLYHIVSENPNIKGQIELNNGLFAYLIVESDTLNVKQFGAKGDGITDDTQALQNCFDYKPKNILLNNERYLISSTLKLYSNIEGKVDSIITFPSQDPTYINDVGPLNSILFIGGINNISIKNLHLIGSYPLSGGELGEHAHGIELRGSNDIVIENCIIENPYGDCVFIRGNYSDQLYKDSCQNIKIQNCTLINPRRCSIAIVNGDYIYILNNKITKPNSYVSAIDIEPNDAAMSAKYIFIENNTFNVVGQAIKSFRSEINNHDPIVLVIKNNYSENNSLFININFASFINIENNIFKNSLNASELRNINSGIYSNNIQKKGVIFVNCNNINVNNNYIENGILHCSNINNFNINSNNMNNNSYITDGQPILIKSGSNINVSNNFIYNTRIGIRLFLDNLLNDCIISNNTIITSKTGINAPSSEFKATNVQILNNTIIHNIQGDTNPDTSFLPLNDSLTGLGNRNDISLYNATGFSTDSVKNPIRGMYLRNLSPAKTGRSVLGWYCVSDGDDIKWVEDAKNIE